MDKGTKKIGCGIFILLMLIVIVIDVFDETKVSRCEKKMMAAIEQNDFAKAHKYLDKIALYCEEKYFDAPAFEKDFYPDAQKLYRAELRYLISQNTDASWERAYLLPLDVDPTIESCCKNIQITLYKELLNFAIEYENEDIQKRVQAKLDTMEN